MNTSHHRAAACRCQILTPLVAVLMVITVGPMVAMAVDDVAKKVETSLADTKVGAEAKSGDDSESDAVNATDASAMTETASELSVAPLDQFSFPDDRPAWLNDLPKLDGDLQSWVVVSSPADSRTESEDELKRLQRAALVHYVQGQTDGDASHEYLSVTDEWIENNLITDRYAGEVKQGDTILYENAVKLSFDKAIQSEIALAWKRVQVRDRLAATGVLVVGGLFCLVFSSFVTGLIGRRVSPAADPQ
ncbi:putative membrane protein [Rhodopirellula maiorica SM1]|uniref:Putative membrane protein n=1 Tax=Rhodopirellula maiorica SM1 TaxID=1265738 RepID=M5RL02_9BACT|nr:hypothetical protein [Rhodopirellula maiorica]EMI19856.1 putative membrane protein [Rhodopirellula maiorica SM1]